MRGDLFSTGVAETDYMPPERDDEQPRVGHELPRPRPPAIPAHGGELRRIEILVRNNAAIPGAPTVDMCRRDRVGVFHVGVAYFDHVPSMTQTRVARVGLNSEEVAGARVAGRVPQLAHGPCFDLTDSFPCQIEVLAGLFERARLATIETEPQLQDLPLALVERGEQTSDLLGQQRGGGNLERRLGRTVLDDVAELGVAVFTQR